MKTWQKVFMTVGLGLGWFGVILLFTSVIPQPFAAILSCLIGFFVVSPIFISIWDGSSEDPWDGKR